MQQSFAIETMQNRKQIC